MKKKNSHYYKCHTSSPNSNQHKVVNKLTLIVTISTDVSQLTMLEAAVVLLLYKYSRKKPRAPSKEVTDINIALLSK